MFDTLVNATPCEPVPWIVPPVQVGVAGVQAPPLPVTLRPLAPVAVRMIPFAGSVLLPVTAILRNVRPLAPIVVLATLSAVPVVVVNVLTMLVLFCVALTVPPPVAVNAALVVVLKLRPPVKVIVAPVLVVSEIRVLVSVIAPLKAMVPPVLPVTLTEWAEPLAIVPL